MSNSVALKFRPVLINGAFSAGRHYFISLLTEMLGPFGVIVKDGLPINRETVPKGVIRHNHVMTRTFPFHLSLNEYGCYLEDSDFDDYGHIFFIRDLRDLLISAWSFRRNYAGESSGFPEHSAYVEYAEKLRSFKSQEDSVIDFIERGDVYGFVPFRDFVEGVLYFFSHPRCEVFSFESVSLNPILELKNFCSIYGYPFSLDSALSAVSKVKRLGRRYRWVPFFTDKIEYLFKSIAADALVKLGYEAGDDWSYKRLINEISNNRGFDCVRELADNPVSVDEGIIKSAYRIFYERHIESEGTLNYHLQKYAGRYIGELRRDFLESDEYKAKFG